MCLASWTQKPTRIKKTKQQKLHDKCDVCLNFRLFMLKSYQV
jgi:hypothetical protein